MDVHRAQVCQRLLNLFDRPRYLEIGVHSAETFGLITAAEKVAVDPYFQFDYVADGQKDSTCVYFQVESDVYFREGAAGTFDVVFLDGLHTYEQTLRDLMNTLAYVRQDSVIVIDDVLPSGHCAAISDFKAFEKVWAATSEPSGDWMGDVYRLVYYIAAFMPMWSYGTVQENHGQLVMWREAREPKLMSVETTARISFTDLIADTSSHNMMPFDAILNRVKESRAKSARR